MQCHKKWPGCTWAPCCSFPTRNGPCCATSRPQPREPLGSGLAASSLVLEPQQISGREDGSVTHEHVQGRGTALDNIPSDISSLCSQQDSPLGASSSRPQPRRPVCCHGLGGCKSITVHQISVCNRISAGGTGSSLRTLSWHCPGKAEEGPFSQEDLSNALNAVEHNSLISATCTLQGGLH